MGRSSDFKFWEEKIAVGGGSCEDVWSEDEAGASSPPLWRRGTVELRAETSTLLRQNHQYSYSCVSPTSGLRAIIDGRREMMEMIKDMPESSYELTLKDIVDQQEKEKEEEEKVVKHEREKTIPQRNTKQICRSESMESQVFLLKMFLPVSLSKKKKKKNKTKPRICPGQAPEGHEKQANKDWWKIIFLAIRDHHKNTNIIRMSRTRYASQISALSSKKFIHFLKHFYTCPETNKIKENVKDPQL